MNNNNNTEAQKILNKLDSSEFLTMNSDDSARFAWRCHKLIREQCEKIKKLEEINAEFVEECVLAGEETFWD